MADNIQFRVDAVLGDTTQLQQQINNLRTNLSLTINNTQALQSIQQVRQQINALQQSMNNMNFNFGGIGGGNNPLTNAIQNTTVQATQNLQMSQTAVQNIQNIISNLQSQVDGVVSNVRLINDENGNIVGGTAQITQATTTWTRHLEQVIDDQGNIVQGQLRISNEGQTIVRTQNRHNESLSEQLRIQMKQYTNYLLIQQAIQSITQGISDCVNYVEKLDSAMTNIRIVTMDTKEATQELLETYNQMGQELGASTTDIAEGSVEWLRQGFSVEDTEELVRTSTIASKLALISNAEATEYLTSALKGYKLEAKDAIGVVDMMTAVDLEAATSAGDLFEAMSKTANLADSTGVAMNELVGMIATVSEVTQSSASIIGNSVKTLFSRMSNIAAGKDIDEMGESLNDVETALNKVGIALRTSENEWRDYYEVLDEIGGKWDSFSSLEQSQITTALGGTRQREQVAVLLSNWQQVQQYAETGANSAGTAMEKYEIVLESVEAKQAQLTAKVEEFYASVLNSGFIAGLLDVSKVLMDIVNLGDGAVGKILLLVTALTALNFVMQSNALSGFRNTFIELGSAIRTVITAIPNLISGLHAQRTAQDALNASMETGSALSLANSWVAIAEIAVLAIMGIKKAIDAHNEAIQESIDKANELTETYKSSHQEIQDGIDSLSSGSGSYTTLVSEFEDLCKGVDEYGNNISLTSDQYERYKSICQQIVGLNPDLMKGYQSETEAIGNKNSTLETTIELLKEEARLNAKEYADKSDKVLEGAKNQYNQSVDDPQGIIDRHWNVPKIHDSNLNGVTDFIASLDTEAQKVFRDAEGENPFFKITEKSFADISKNWDTYKSELETIRQNAEKYAKKYDVDFSDFYTAYDNFIDGIEGYINNPDAQQALKDIKKANDTFYSDLEGIYSATAMGTKGYDNLGGNSRNFLADFYSEAFKVDDPTTITKDVVNANKKTVVSIVNALNSDEDDEIEKALGEFYKIDPDTIDYDNYEQQSQEVAEKISNILQQDLTGDGCVDSADVAKIKLALDAEVDVDKIKERTEETQRLFDELSDNDSFDSKGLKQYLNSLDTKELNKAKVVLQSFIDEAGNLNTEIIGSVDDIKAYVQSFSEIDSALNGVSEGFTSATSAKNAFEATMDGITEYDDNFNSYTSAIEMLEGEFENGTVGSKTFAEACKYLFGEGFDVTNVDQAYKQLQTLKKVFEEDTYGEGMLKQIQKLNKDGKDLGDTFAKQNADGTWDFDIDTSEKGIKKLAKALGTTEEGVWSVIESMQMLGGVDLFDLDTIYDFASQFGELGFIAEENGEKIQAIDVDGLRDKLDKAGISTTYLDDALVGLAEKGVVLLDVSADAETLKGTLSQLNLVAKDGIVDVDNLVSSLSVMGYSNEQIATVLSTLQGLDGVNFINLGDGVSDVQGKIDSLKTSTDTGEDSLEAMKTKAQQLDQVTLTTIQGAIDTVTDKLNTASTTCGTLVTNLNKIDGTHTVTINYVEFNKPTSAGGLHGIGNGISHNGRSYLKGTAFNHGHWGAKKDVTALTAEKEPEIWVHTDTGEWELLTNPQFVKVKKGDIIFNGKQTKDLLNKGASANFGTSFLNGTAYTSGSSWGKWKKKYGITNSSSSSSNSKSKSSSSSKEWWETQLENLKNDLDYNSITMDTYISGLEKILAKLKKGSDAWKEINKELQEAKLDNIENQFNRGEITIDQYISKLTDLRKNYKKNTEGYKELTQTINEAKADKYADQYERGEISLNSYIKQLTKLRNAYKKNSEEWKKYNDLINETKHDKYQDQYERGEISANTYIKRLQQLQKQYKKGSEEYKEIAKEITETLIESYDKALDKIDDSIDKMGDVNTAKEQVKYAKLLSKKYKTINSQISSIQKQLKKNNLTAEQRIALQEKLNDLLKEEVDIRDEIEDGVREYYENQKERLEKEAELAKKQTLYNKEVELYGKQGKDLWEYNNDKKIDALQEQIDLREAEKEALDDINEREELENDLLEARLKLQNALNNKTTKILTKQEDGTWAYTYSANMADVKEAQKEVESAEKALDDFDWEQETKELEKQLEELNKNAENLANQYEDAEFWADREYEQTMNSIERAYGNIDKLVQDWMNTYGKTDDKLTTAFTSLTSANNSLEASITKLSTYIEGYYETVGSNGKIIPTDGVKSFDTGGQIIGDGLALVHDKERVLTNKQNEYFEQLVDKLPQLLDMVDVGKFNTHTNSNLYKSQVGNTDNTQTVISKVECVFPNITTTEGLQRAMLELPRLALQQKK